MTKIDRLQIIKEIVERNHLKLNLIQKTRRSSVKLRNANRRVMSENDIDKLAGYASFNNDIDPSFDGRNDSSELKEDRSIIDAYEEGKNE